MKPTDSIPMKTSQQTRPIQVLFATITVLLFAACGQKDEGGSETSKSMPEIKGFHLGMSSDEANKILDNLLDKNLQEELDLKFTDNKLVSISFKLGSSSSAKLFNDGGMSTHRFVEEFGEAYDLPLTFTIPDVSSPGSLPGFETTTYSYENRDVGYSVKIQASDLINKNGSSFGAAFGLDFELIYSKIKSSAGLTLGD